MDQSIMEEYSEYSYLRNNDPMDVPYTTIPDMILRHSQKDPKSVAHVYINWETFEKEYLTFLDLYLSGTKFAKGLMQLGVVQGDIIALGTDNCPSWMTAMVGIQMCGAIPLMFTFNLKDGSDVDAMLQKAGHRCKAIVLPRGRMDINVSILDNFLKKGNGKGEISHQSLPNMKWAITTSVGQENGYFSVNDICEMGDADITLPNIDPEDVGAIFQTSGSTGSPKLIPHTHFSILVAGSQLGIAYGKSSSTLFNDRPFTWIGGFPCWEILTGGSRIVIKHLSDIPSLEEYFGVLRKVLQDEKYESSLLLTGILHKLLNDESKEWKFQNVAVGGTPIPRMLTKIGSDSCERFVVVYGSSELAFGSCAKIGDVRDHVDYEAGYPFPGVEVKVVNSDGTLLKRGERGELYIRSPVRFPGYMNDIEQTTSAHTATGWYKSGDSAIMKQDGCLIIEGRMSDSIIKTQEGFLSVALMEGQLKQHPSVQDAIVVVLSDEEHFKRICCAIVLKPDLYVTDEQLKEYLLDTDNKTGDIYRKILLPKHFVFFDSFPKTHSGKINRKEVATTCVKKISKK